MSNHSEAKTSSQVGTQRNSSTEMSASGGPAPAQGLREQGSVSRRPRAAPNLRLPGELWATSLSAKKVLPLITQTSLGLDVLLQREFQGQEAARITFSLLGSGTPRSMGQNGSIHIGHIVQVAISHS